MIRLHDHLTLVAFCVLKRSALATGAIRYPNQVVWVSPLVLGGIPLFSKSSPLSGDCNQQEKLEAHTPHGFQRR